MTRFRRRVLQTLLILLDIVIILGFLVIDGIAGGIPYSLGTGAIYMALIYVYGLWEPSANRARFVAPAACLCVAMWAWGATSLLPLVPATPPGLSLFNHLLVGAFLWATRILVFGVSSRISGPTTRIVGEGKLPSLIREAVWGQPAGGLRILTYGASGRPPAQSTPTRPSLDLAPKADVPLNSSAAPQGFGKTLSSWTLPDGTRILSREAPCEGMSRRVKRTMDLGLALPMLVAIIPLMAFLALMVCLTSPGPAFHVQERLTAARRPFRIYKLRTMVQGAEVGGEAVWPTQQDHRITPIGHQLRRLWLDELPQLLNVIKGDISLVGPRPERPKFAQVFTKGLTRYPQRYRALSGLTGWAQINGFVGNTSIRKRLTCDLSYVREWSPVLDVCILACTFVRLFRRRPRPVLSFVPEQDAWIP